MVFLTLKTKYGFIKAQDLGEIMETRKIMLIEDDVVTRTLLAKMLENHNYNVVAASSVPEALSLFNQEPVPVILSDIEMRPLKGTEILKHIRTDEAVTTPLVIFMTSKSSLANAFESISHGAFDYIGKPIVEEALISILDRAFLQQSCTKRAASISPECPSFGLVGSSSKMAELYKNVARAALSDSNVFIWGESGTGKELIAKAIHENSFRKDNRFVTVNCGALTETLLESELFGHIKGSFTGAIANKKGLFEEANGGTLFLDEIGDISPGLQVKLLRVIQEGEFKPVGSVENRRVNVRIIAATHRHLAKMVQEEKFREDLFYRLKVLTLQLPALRERKEDVIPLARYFLSKKTIPGRSFSLAENAIARLLDYSWPGNIRELENAVERAIAMSQGDVLYAEDFLLTNISKHSAPAELEQSIEKKTITYAPPPIVEEPLWSLEELEKRHIARVIKSTHFNKTKAAQILGIDRATLYRKAEKYQICLGEKEEASFVLLAPEKESAPASI